MRLEKKFDQKKDDYKPHKQGGAVEACWAHNPEVNGSKPFPPKNVTFILLFR